MNPIALLAGIVAVALLLFITNGVNGLFIEAQQTQLVYMGITILGAIIVIGAFKGA